MSFPEDSVAAWKIKASHMLRKLTQDLVFFTEYVHLYGRLTFDIEGKEKVCMSLSEMISPAPFSELNTLEAFLPDSTFDHQAHPEKVSSWKRGRKKVTPPQGIQDTVDESSAESMKEEYEKTADDLDTTTESFPMDNAENYEGQQREHNEGFGTHIDAVKVEDDTEEAQHIRTEMDNSMDHSENRYPSTNRYPPTNQKMRKDKYKPEQCQFCSACFTTKYRLDKHVANLHATSVLCSQCDARFNKTTELKVHFRAEHPEESFPLVVSCDICFELFETSSAMEEHKQKQHSHPCDFCARVFFHTRERDKHCDEAHAGQKPVCGFCGQRFGTVKLLRRHKRSRHRGKETGLESSSSPSSPSSSSSCPECGKSCASPYARYLHQRAVHRKLGFYACTLCDKTFAYHNTLKLHRLHHSGERPFKCGLCEKTYLSSSHLKAHMKAVHCDVKRYECPTCSKRFRHSLRMHMRRHNTPTSNAYVPSDATNTARNDTMVQGLHQTIVIVPSSTSSVFPTGPTITTTTMDRTGADQNPATSHTDPSLQHTAVSTTTTATSSVASAPGLTITGMNEQLHKSAITAARVLEIVPSSTVAASSTIAPSSTITLSSQQQKSDSCQQQKSDSCQQQKSDSCQQQRSDSSQQQKSDSSQQQKSDSSQQTSDSSRQQKSSQRSHRYVCETCGLRFMYRSALLTHSATHTEVRAFLCPDCPARFRTYATLYSHRRTHSSDKPFPCDICSKRFKTNEILKRHRQRHSGEKPFQCDRCQSCFPDKGGLSKHQRTVHSTVPGFQCPACGKTCSRADNLRVHMKSHNNPDLLKLSRDELMMKQEDLSIGAGTTIVSITAINSSNTVNPSGSNTTNPTHNTSHNPSIISNPSHTVNPSHNNSAISLNPSHISNPSHNPSSTANMIQVLLQSEMDEPPPSGESPGQPIQQQYILHPASTQPGNTIALPSLYVLDPNTQTFNAIDSFPQQHVPQ